MQNEPLQSLHRSLWLTRNAMCEALLSDAVMIANRVGHPLVHEITRYLLDFYEPCVPTEQGLFHRLLSTRESGNFFYLMPLTSQDCDINVPGHSEEIRRASKAIGYYCDRNEACPGRLYVNTIWPMTPVWRGILLIHEGHHALLDSKRPELLTELQHVEEEIQVFDLEAAVALEIGGVEYQEILIREVERVQSNLTASPDGMNFETESSRYRAELDAIFGEPLSEPEQEMRQAVFGHQVAKFLFSLLYKERAEEEFLQHRFRNWNTLFKVSVDE